MREHGVRRDPEDRFSRLPPGGGQGREGNRARRLTSRRFRSSARLTAQAEVSVALVARARREGRAEAWRVDLRRYCGAADELVHRRRVLQARRWRVCAPTP